MNKSTAQNHGSVFYSPLPVSITPLNLPGCQHPGYSVQPAPSDTNGDKGGATAAARKLSDKPSALQERLLDRQVQPLTGEPESHLQLKPEPNPAPDLDPDLSQQNLRINYPAPDWIPLEELIASPPFTPTLERDTNLTRDLQQPASLHRFEQLLHERRQADENKKEFKLDLLMPTLRNMKTFISHIRSGKQFTAPLTAKEQTAMAWLADKTQQLLDAEAPYRRSVHLAIALMALCEIITKRQVLDPLLGLDPLKDSCSQQPKLWEFSWAFSRAVDPLRIIEYCWGGNNPGGPDELERLKKNDLTGPGYGLRYLATALDSNWLLAVPSFENLDLKDFCCFGHLPVHPIGMTTAYALNADGKMHSPLMFALHDIGHMQINLAIGAGTPAALSLVETIIRNPHRRLDWRHMLLDSMPARLAHLKFNTALVLLLFQIFHERAPCESAQTLGNRHPALFFRCFDIMANVRRRARTGYAQVYQSVTDRQAARAVLWALALWEYWQAADFRPLLHDELEACARTFEQTDLPVLDKHLDFLETHRGALRQLIAHRFCTRKTTHTGICVQVSSMAFGSGWQGVPFFTTRVEGPGLCHFDNTDVFYFKLLSSPALRQGTGREIENALGVRFPDAAAQERLPEPQLQPHGN